jgi:hypothetical protein
MEIDKLHKIINLQKHGDTTVVSIGGLVALEITGKEGSFFAQINPVFAKLAYGASKVWVDVPHLGLSETLPDAIAAGLTALHDKGAFSTMVDLPDDSTTINESSSDLIASYIQKRKEQMKGLQKDMLTPRNVLPGDANDVKAKAAAAKWVKHAANVAKAEIKKNKKDYQKELSEAEIIAISEIFSDCEEFGLKCADTVLEANEIAEEMFKYIAEGRRSDGKTKDELFDVVKTNIEAGRRATHGMDRNEKLRAIRAGVFDHPDFKEHKPVAGRPTLDKAIKDDESRENEPKIKSSKELNNVFSMWAAK